MIECVIRRLLADIGARSALSSAFAVLLAPFCIHRYAPVDARPALFGARGAAPGRRAMCDVTCNVTCARRSALGQCDCRALLAQCAALDGGAAVARPVQSERKRNVAQRGRRRLRACALGGGQPARCGARRARRGRVASVDQSTRRGAGPALHSLQRHAHARRQVVARQARTRLQEHVSVHR